MSANSLFHAGELRLQQRTGAKERIAGYADRMIRDYIPEQHRLFYQSLSYVFIGATDSNKRVWASALFGTPGFIQCPDPYTMLINAHLLEGDPLQQALMPGADIGILGIELSNRRRNRLSGVVVCHRNGQIQIAVKQTFGNCPKYIHTRSCSNDTTKLEAKVEHFTALYQPLKTIIQGADSFYVASHSGGQAEHSNGGADVSYRGGQPGFVQINDSKMLTIPDFAGNFHFNTLGNFELNPNAGLLFIDFEQGDILYLNGKAEVRWEPALLKPFIGAERVWQFRIESAIKLSNALPYRFQLQEYSPFVDMTAQLPSLSQAV